MKSLCQSQTILFLLSSILFLQISALPSPSPSPPNRHGKLVVFGDSLSDNGNGWRITNHTWPSDPAYYKHTFSNGPVWVDYLAESLGLTLDDYAVGGATSDNTVVQGFTGKHGNITVPSLIDQCDSYLGSHQIGDHHDDDNENLHVISIGGNDIILGLDIDGVVPAVSKVVRDLHLIKGATRFLIVIPPDISTLPYSQFIPASTSARLSSLSQALRTQLTRLEATLSRFFSITLVDLIFLFDEMVAFPESFGFSAEKTGVSCLRGAYGEVPRRSLCSDPARYIFWDEFHPTTRAHRYISLRALRDVNMHARMKERSSEIIIS